MQRWEIMGPPGSGKSTIAKRLIDQIPPLRPARRLSRHRHLREYGSRILTSSPRMLAHYLLHARFGWREVRERIGVETLHDVLRQGDRSSWNGVGKESTDRSIVLFDQGPLFSLSRLVVFQRNRADVLGTRCGWTEMARCWGPLMHRIIWLDAPDSLLIERVAARKKDHAIKQKPTREALRWLADARRRLETTIATVQAHGNLEILKFDTSKESLETIVQLVATATCPAEGRILRDAG